MADELKPCPFCGTSSWEFRIVDIEDREGTPCAYTCGECGASAPWMYLRKSGDESNPFDDARLIRRLNGRPIEDALRAEVAVLREQRDHKFEQFLDWRGIEVGEQCDRCQGAGSYMYSSTATWMGGIGGQAMTVGVCDKCWGSGKKNSPWTNLRDVMQIRREIAALKDERDECALGVMTASERAGRYANQIASLKAAKARAAEAFPAVIPFIGADDDGYACNAAMEALSAYFAEEAAHD